MRCPPALSAADITVLAYGALLSEAFILKSDPYRIFEWQRH
jgi:hypothetical protein